MNSASKRRECGETHKLSYTNERTSCAKLLKCINMRHTAEYVCVRHKTEQSSTNRIFQTESIPVAHNEWNSISFCHIQPSRSLSAFPLIRMSGFSLHAFSIHFVCLSTLIPKRFSFLMSCHDYSIGCLRFFRKCKLFTDPN